MFRLARVASSQGSKKMGRLPIFAVYLLIASLLFPSPAHAYLDPGTGSMIVQLVIGAVAVAGMTLKMYWRKIMDLFGHRPNDKKNAED